MKTMALVLAVASLVAHHTLSAQGDDLSNVEIKATKVAGSVWMLQGAGGNIGVSAGPDGILIVDDQFAPLADKIRAAIKSIDPGRIAFVLNTHWHGDHTGGNATFGREATILAHDNVRLRLIAKQKDGLPVITYPNDVTVWWNGEEIDVHHVPHGHTDGDSVIVFRGSNVVHLGDQLFIGTFPFIDLASGGDLAGYTKNLADLIASCPAGARVIPGHGPLGTVDDMRKAHAMLVATTEIVRERRAAGVPLQDAKKAGLPAEWASWASDSMPVERWVEFLYRSLEK